MLISKQNIDAIFWQWNLLFQKAYGLASSFWAQVAMSAPSTASETHYPWQGMIPSLREWLGPRVAKNLQARSYTIVNRKFEATLSVPRDKFEDEQYGVYGNQAEGLGRSAKVWPDQLVAAAMAAGTSALCFDGQPYFDGSHPIDQDNAGGTTYRNRFDNSVAGGSSPTPLTHENFRIVQETMMQYVGEDGVPLGINPDLLVVPPSLKTKAAQILEMGTIAPNSVFGAEANAGPQENPLKGAARVLVVPYLTQQDAWYLIDSSRGIMPFVFQLRNAAEFTWLNKPDDPNVFERDEYLYGVRARGNAGYSLPFLAARASATA